MFCFVFCFVSPLLSLCEAYLKDNKHNKRLLVSETCKNSCPGTFLFLKAHSRPRANCSLLGTDNILGQLSVHVSSLSAVYCLYSPFPSLVPSLPNENPGSRLQFSLPHFILFLFKRLEPMYFLSLGVKGLNIEILTQIETASAAGQRLSL